MSKIVLIQPIDKLKSSSLIRYCFAHYKYYCFIMYNNEEYSRKNNIFLESIQKSIVDVKKTYEWPGTTKFDGNPVTQYVVEINMADLPTIEQYFKTIDELKNYGDFEDLSFLNINRIPKLVTVQHESILYFDNVDYDEDEIVEYLKINNIGYNIIVE